jgi:endoribonuclease Dicer
MKDPKFAQQLKGSYTVNAKRTVFLVPTRPLVKQQAAEIRRHFDVKVGEYTGDMNVDFWKKDQWIKELIKNEVIVMTPQIFLNMLNHNFIKFDKINLIIFDEVHWAAKRKGKKESVKKVIIFFYLTSDLF